MTPWERWAYHATAWATGLTGLGYGWLRYFGAVQGEFGPEPHPAQALLQHAHVFTTALQLFMLGVLVRGHLQPKLRARKPKGRRTGLWVALALAPMVLAGFGIQCTVHPGLRLILAWIHGLSGSTYLLGYGAHMAAVLLLPRRMRELQELPFPVMEIR